MRFQALGEQCFPPRQFARAVLRHMVDRAGVSTFGFNKPGLLDAMQVSTDGTAFAFEVHLLITSDSII